MQRRLVCWTVVMIGSWIAMTAHPAAAQSISLPADFANAYRSALLTMKDAYSKGTIRGTVKLEYPQVGKSLDQRFTMRVAGNWFRLDATVTAEMGMNVELDKSRLILATPQVSLQGTRGSKGLLPNSSQIVDYGDADTSIHAICPLSFPYTMGGQNTILEMLQSGGTTIKSFKTGTLDGQRVIQIKYRQSVDPQGRQGPWQCTLYVSPDEGYALRSFSRTAGQGDRQLTLAGSLSYTVNPDNIPLLDRLERREHRGSAVIERQSMGISEFDTNRPTNYWFTADGINQSVF